MGELSDEARFDEARFAAALAALGAGPRRLRMFLDGYAPHEAWEALSAGKHRNDPDGAYRDKASPGLLDRVTAACAQGEAAVRVLGRPGYPEALAHDPQAPAVVFTLGEPARLDRRPLVAIVGTRSATTYGLGIASEIGRGLAEAGVGVVSGLAQGIDAAAHAGAIAAADDGGPPVAVLGAALDAPVPPARRSLLDAVARRGAVLSELPPGTRGAPGWWFAVRNRVMAAMAHVVVVVESHLTGGSWYTVTAAAARGVTVAAVPGSVRSPASAGTNRLLGEGAVPVRDVDDVLTALELAVAGRPDIVRPMNRTRPARLTRHAPSAVIGPVAKRVRRALDHDPAPLDVVVRRTGLALGEVALALEQLAEAGLAQAAQGCWSRSG